METPHIQTESSADIKLRNGEVFVKHMETIDELNKQMKLEEEKLALAIEMRFSKTSSPKSEFTLMIEEAKNNIASLKNRRDNLYKENIR